MLNLPFPFSSYEIGAAEMHHTSNDITALIEQSPIPEYWEWSNREDGWVVMTFDEHRAWLIQPDLDPAKFACSEMAP